MTAQALDDPLDAGERQRLPERALQQWRVATLLAAIPSGAVAAVVAVAIPGLPGWVRLLIALLPIVVTLIDLASQPIRYRLWWYAIDAEELTLRHGWPITSLTVVPMVRVQHVSVAHGPLARRFRLADLHVHTAAGKVTIPSLDREQAERIRRQIAELARIVDDL